MTWPTGKNPSPKQLVQRNRYVYKGYITGLHSNARRWMQDKYTSTQEKVYLSAILAGVEKLIQLVDLESKKQIREAK